MLPDIEALPVRVRPAPYETIESYSGRLAEANFMPMKRWRAGLRAVQRAGGDGAARLESAVEVLGELRPAHFATERMQLPAHHDGARCVKCATGLEQRFGCTRCAGGAIARQAAHDGSRVCRKHRRWIGPGTQPDQQYPVGPEVVRADRAYRKLRRNGVLDAHRLAEILGCVDYWCDAEVNGKIDPAARFCLAISLARCVLAPLKTGRLWRGADEPSERYEVLARAVAATVDGSCVALVDALWEMLRAAYRQGNDDAHRVDIVTSDAFEPADGANPTRSCAYPQFRHRHLTQFVNSVETGTRFDLARSSFKKHEYACALGHRFTSYTRKMAPYKSSDGCPFCARRAPLAGFNTLADSHPHLAAEWHPTLNRELRPEHILSGSSQKVAWLCPEGHSYRREPATRVRGVGCGYCSNHLVDPATNSMAVTHPALAADWHPTKNGRVTPDLVTAVSKQAFWWSCSLGHEIRQKASARVRRNGCTVCYGRTHHPSTSLLSTHPEIAALWHPSLNGSLMPEHVGAGSGRRVWWLCERGHVADRMVLLVVASPACSQCKDRASHERDSMSSTHPAIAAEFHPTRNGALTAKTIPASTTRKLWWQCVKGHEWQARGNRRASGAGRCLVCSNRRVVSGENDMATTHPQLALEFHPTKNAPLTPSCVIVGTSQELWWRCELGHEWRAPGHRRARGRRCPDCARVCIAGFNDLPTTHPAIARDWDQDRNRQVSPTAVKATTQRKIWWLCPRGHAERESVRVRVERGECATCNHNEKELG